MTNFLFTMILILHIPTTPVEIKDCDCIEIIQITPEIMPPYLPKLCIKIKTEI